MSEPIEQPRRLDVIKAEIKEIEAFLQTPGWKKYEELVQSVLFVWRRDAFESPIRTIDAAFSAADQKGNIAGMQYCFSLLHIRLTSLQEELQDIKNRGTLNERAPVGGDTYSDTYSDTGTDYIRGP